MRYMINTYGNVDLGTLDWNKDGLNFYTDDISNKVKKTKDGYTVANIYCNLYRAVPVNVSFIEGDIAIATSGALYIRDTRYITTAEFKEAMRGQILRYELETPANGGYLPMYKGRYKVSDVCQLLDKSTFPATQTVNGVTFTNNGDGTITANGTATGGNATFRVQHNITVVAGHKYLVSVDYTNQVCIQLYALPDNIFVPYDIANVPQIITCITTYNQIYYEIIFYDGVTVSNAILKPQLFDLTEMYGAGNEPTTVAEFKEKFPADLYPYSPYCWAKIKQMRYMTTTKNLFGYSPINIASDMANGTIVESLPNGAIVQGDVGAEPGHSNYSSGWFRPGYTPDGPVIKPHLLAGDTVTISCDYLILERNYAFLTDVGIYLNDGSHGFSDVVIFGLEVGKHYRLTATYTVDIEGDYYPIFTINSNKTKVTNIQIEKGSTATPYVPYGYLPLK